MNNSCVVLFRSDGMVDKVYGPLTIEMAFIVAAGLRADGKKIWHGNLTKAG